jgi:hypothetical protein
LLDDCSTDDSWDILTLYASNPKVTFIERNLVNSGSPFHQWVRGIQLAKGNWIWIAESDDYSDSNFLAELIREIKPDIDLIYCRSNEVDEEGNILGLQKWADQMDPNRWLSTYENDGSNEIQNYLFFRNTIVNASAVIFRKPKSIPSPLTGMQFCGDWYFWIWLLRHGRIRYVASPLNFMRTHSGSTRSLKSCDRERIRFYEITNTINSIVHFNKWALLTIFFQAFKYEWLINDILFKSRRFGLSSKFALQPILPIMLLPYYYLKLFKFSLLTKEKRRALIMKN